MEISYVVDSNKIFICKVVQSCGCINVRTVVGKGTLSASIRDFCNFANFHTGVLSSEMEASDIGTVPETLIRDTNVSAVIDWEKEVAEIDRGVGEDDSAMKEEDASLADLMVCDSGARMVPGGFNRSDCAREDCVMFVNAGCDEGFRAPDANVEIVAYARYEGGEAFRTEEHVEEAGDCPFIYQSARLGNCCRFDNLAPGHYSIDLHFSEIINTNGPKGMRVFNVFLQDEKVLSEFDIFAVVGSNKPLQIVNLRASVKDDGVMRLKFDGIHGSPLVSGICIKKATNISAHHGAHECKNCSAEIAKLKKRIKELRKQCQPSNDECYEACMSLTLEQSRMDLDEMHFKAHSLDQTFRQQASMLSAISGQYEHEKKFWGATIAKLEEKLKREAHECDDSIPELTQMVSAVQGLVAQCEYLKVKCKPKGRSSTTKSSRKCQRDIRMSWTSKVLEMESGDLAILAGGSSKKIFKFDRVYTSNDDQVDVFADASPLVVSVLDGFNVCIFAYGQTGTGKTFTMEGPEHHRGVNYRTVEQLFEIARERSEMFSYDICVSVLEVYNEQLRDLLAALPSSKKLEIKQGSEGSHHVPGIVEARVESLSKVWNVLQAGAARGQSVKARNLLSRECTKSKLWLVDLSGSEQLAKTDAQGERLKEAKNINRSLSALGDVISALASKSSHIPYRNSKLTHLLQDSLGKDSKTLMFVQISPSENDLGQTLSSLKTMLLVDTGPARKQVDTGEIQKLKTMLEKARQEARSKDELVRKLEDSLQNMESKSEKQLLQLSKRLREKEENCVSLQHKVRELESKLREGEQSESAAYEQKVLQIYFPNGVRFYVQIKELEMKLKDKIKEPEKRLRDHEQNPEIGFLQLKEKDSKKRIWSR
uniref:Kinesin motor domain-containing protein n=1 Tax=Kalanchoe fedtschenkoi TaxID=63787 RepID=A0A7N0TDB9_KALFE